MGIKRHILTYIRIKRYTAVEHHGHLPHKLRVALRQARKSQGLSQLDVARDAGLTQKHISKIETG
ncbi:MAG: helix-turn-helix transcriptional regulator, partial [Proteobacteria bacterium]|nr:helix-turn-helix transcriptional regulator [Pseudomonadota bacterium]